MPLTCWASSIGTWPGRGTPVKLRASDTDDTIRSGVPCSSRSSRRPTPATGRRVSGASCPGSTQLPLRRHQPEAAARRRPAVSSRVRLGYPRRADHTTLVAREHVRAIRQRRARRSRCSAATTSTSGRAPPARASGRLSSSRSQLHSSWPCSATTTSGRGCGDRGCPVEAGARVPINEAVPLPAPSTTWCCWTRRPWRVAGRGGLGGSAVSHSGSSSATAPSASASVRLALRSLRRRSHSRSPDRRSSDSIVLPHGDLASFRPGAFRRRRRTSRAAWGRSSCRSARWRRPRILRSGPGSPSRVRMSPEPCRLGPPLSGAFGGPEATVTLVACATSWL